MPKKVKEWFIDTVFGEVASMSISLIVQSFGAQRGGYLESLPEVLKTVISWGDATRPPILMIHGFMDTAATFSSLQEQLPDSYYYVAFDIPGHGKSCQLPVGPPPSQATAMEALRSVVDHMAWKSFVLIGHSMGGVIGMFYNHLFPGKITKMILLDPLPALCNFYYMTHDMQTFYGFFYDEYYNKFLSSSDRPKLFTYEKAVTLMMTNRELSREKAEVVLSRSLVPVTDELYRFTTQPIMKKIGLFPIQTDVLMTILWNQPPTLSLVATGQNVQKNLKSFCEQLMSILKKENNALFFIEGHHDIHIANPEALAPFIVDFLNLDNLVKVQKAKL